MSPSHAIYQPGRLWLCATCHTYVGDRILVDYTEGETAAAYLERQNATRDPGSPELVMLTIDEALAAVLAAEEAIAITPWEPITEERFRYFLEVLPPCRWEKVSGVELFYVSEAYTSNIHTHCARLGTQYFIRQCRTSTPYATLAAEVAAIAA